MVNDVRNLILNTKANQFSSLDIGYEYMPPTFVEKQLPANVVNARKILFGTNPTSLFKNVRWRQIAPFIHNDTFQEYIDALDTRCTYWPFNQDNFFDFLGNIIKDDAVYAGEEHYLEYLGQPVADEYFGRIYYKYRIYRYQNYIYIFDAVNYVTEFGPAYFSTLENQENTQIPLGDSGVSVYSRPGTTGVLTLQQVYLYGKLTIPFSTILSKFEKALLNSGGIAWLFPEPRVEPYKTFYNLYKDHPLDSMRYGALFMALAYRTNEMPQKH